ncbi:hypothetical protein BC937DRAFT_87782 [Endogone sp. FLAS-F59071]|nr:hypothetical protein BC937DRAFT_87782 [Endogone sp. FLAS-F59071]|eukprot:RUS19241.1 hypothetical protein BC937DRAFT_87782 [Endogone sp. FLAS-F59071]
MDYHFPHQAKDPHNRRPRTPQQQPLLVAPVPTRALPNYSQFLSASPPPMSSPPLRSASPNPSTSSGGRSSHSPKPRGRPRPLSFHSQLSGSSSTASPSDTLGLAPPGAGAPQPMKSTGSGSTEWHGTDYFGLQRVPSPVPSSSGLWTSRSSAAIKRTASHNSFLSPKMLTDSGNSSAANMRSGLRHNVPLADTSYRDSDYFNQDTSPTTLTKTPTYEYYGFVLYLGSFIAFVLICRNIPTMGFPPGRDSTEPWYNILSKQILGARRPRMDLHADRLRVCDFYRSQHDEHSPV